MKSSFKYLYLIFFFVLILTQYQNCSNSSDGNFWNNGNGASLAPDSSAVGQASIQSSSTVLTNSQDFTEIAGICNPGTGNTGTLSYQVFDTYNNLISINPSYTSAKCDAGRFDFVVPKPACTGPQCSFLLRAKFTYGSNSTSLSEYLFKVVTTY